MAKKMWDFETSKQAAAKKVYTLEQWKIDGHFAAKEGQEITEEVYNQMRDCVPPLRLPKAKAEWALQHLRIPVHGGFLMGEVAWTSEAGTPMYFSFGMNDYGRGKPDKHYYYLGWSEKDPELNGVFYYFDCMNALVNKMFKAEAFENDREAVAFGANYEATVIKYTYENDVPISVETLYDPFNIFDD